MRPDKGIRVVVVGTATLLVLLTIAGGSSRMPTAVRFDRFALAIA